MSTKDYKARKEAFVSNLSGSSLLDINLVTLVAPAAILLWTALQKRQSFFKESNIVTNGVDFLLNVGGILFAFTLYSSAPIILNICFAIPAVFLLLPLLPSEKVSKSTRKKASSGSSTTAKHTKSNVAQLPNRPFITHYRGAMMIATCVAILAVDFPVFPRRFAKVETWGTSLMDLGVGSFVFSAGVVSARQVISSATSDSKRPALYHRLLASLRHSAPLIALGLVRLYSVKGLDYAEHVTEYGVHWNFFFTLGLLPPFVELSDFLIKTIFRSYDILAVVIALIYEIILNNTSLLSYILISPRGPSLLSKNREGVFSFIGYLAIFLSGRGIGVRILPFHTSTTTQQKQKLKSSDQTATTKDRLIILRNLSLTALAYATLFTLCTSYTFLNINTSRRLSNAPYIFWIATYNNAQLFVFAAIEHFGPKFTYLNLFLTSYPTTTTTTEETEATPEQATSKIMRSFNRNGLVIFLIANLLTGLVNLTVNTLDVGNGVAMAVLVAYAGIVAGVAGGFDGLGWRVKL